jgi:hypothetical protein
MDEKTKVDEAGRHGESLELVAERFKHWRENRRRGARIPKALWAAAVELAQLHGAKPIAQALHVDVNALTRRMARCGAAPGKGDTQFMELVAPPMPTPVHECVVELRNARGARMRVELTGTGVAALAGVCSAFFGAR